MLDAGRAAKNWGDRTVNGMCDGRCESNADRWQAIEADVVVAQVARDIDRGLADFDVAFLPAGLPSNWQRQLSVLNALDTVVDLAGHVASMRHGAVAVTGPVAGAEDPRRVGCWTLLAIPLARIDSISLLCVLPLT